MTGPQPDPSWRQYPCTVLEIYRSPDGAEGVPWLEVDLREPLQRSAVDALASLGLGRTWAVVTAYNPHGEPRDEGNAARHARLTEAVERIGAPFARVDGRSPDASHREVGLAIALPQPEAVALAARFGQSAIFWFDGEAFWLVPAAAAAGPVRLPP